MVYATPSYLVYLLATKNFMLASLTLISLSIGWPTVGMSDQPKSWSDIRLATFEKLFSPLHYSNLRTSQGVLVCSSSVCTAYYVNRIFLLA